MQDKIKEPVSNTKLLVGLIIVVCAVVLAVHWPVLSAKALSFDDELYFGKNLLVQTPSWESAWRFLTEILPSTVGGYYQPLTMISLMVDYALGGQVDNLTQFHRTNLTIHITNTALIIVLLYLLFGNIWIASGIGLLFGVHPMTVEPVAWVSERKTLLAAFFAFWCLILYVCFARKKNRGLYLCCIAMYILALMSKPTSTPLPLMMLLMDYWPLKRLNRRTILEKIPFFVVGAISAIITYISQSRTAGAGLPAKYGFERIPFVLCHNIVFYLYKIVWPVNLSSHYAYPATFSLSVPMLAAAVIGSCVLIALLITSLRWTRAALTGWLVFFVALLPTMQIIGFSKFIASDKFAYLPSIGLLMILTTFVVWVCNEKKTLTRHIVVVIIVLILSSAEAIGTRKYLAHWRSTVSLAEYFLALTPDSASANMMMGYALQNQERLDEAANYYRRSVQLTPDSVDALNNLGVALKLQGNFSEAVDCFRNALEGAPQDAEVHYNLGYALESAGKTDEAINQYQQALKIKPEHASAHFNLANALSQQGKFDEAINHYRQILKVKTLNAAAYNNLGFILQKQGKLDEAIECYKQALHANPDFREAHSNLIYIWGLQNKLDEAINYYQQVLQINLEYADAYNRFGAALLSRGNPDEAIRQFHLALQSEPNFVEAYNNLALAFQRQGKLDDAIINYSKVLELKPDHIKTYLKVGNLLASQNKLDEAIGYFSQAIHLEPNNAEAHYNMGMALALTNRPSEAIEHFKQAMRLKPSWSEPAVWLAKILATDPDSEVHDPNNAVIIAAYAAELTKYQDPQVLEILAISYAAVGQFEMAVETAQEALKLAYAAQNNELVSRLRNMIERYKAGDTLNTKSAISE